MVGLSIFSHFRWTLSDSTLLRFLVFWRRCCTPPARWDKSQVRFLRATTGLHHWRPGAVGENQGGGLHLHPQLGYCAQTQPGQVCVWLLDYIVISVFTVLPSFWSHTMKWMLCNWALWPRSPPLPPPPPHHHHHHHHHHQDQGHLS